MNNRALQIVENLRLVGFQENQLGPENIWKLSSTKSSGPVKAKIEILQRKEQFTLTKCNVVIDCDKLQNEITSIAKKKFRKILSISGRITENNAIQCLFELAPTKSNASEDNRANHLRPPTLLGWTTNISQNDQFLLIQITDAFMVGPSLENWWPTIMQVVTEALAPGMHHLWTVNNLFEITLPIWLLPTKAKEAPNDLNSRSELNLVQAIRIPTPITSAREGKKIAIALSAEAPSDQPDNPIEILEARETADTWLAIDKKILERRPVSIPEDLKTQDTAAILCRIAASPSATIDNEILNRALGKIPAKLSLTALTGATILLEKNNRDNELVKLISDLLRQAGHQYGDLNFHLPFQSALPEILGDLWSKVDQKRALVSWQTALMTSKNNRPRILNKIAGLARETRDNALEFQTLLELCEQERRSIDLRLAALRLIEIADDTKDFSIELKGKYKKTLEQTLHRAGMDHRVAFALAKIQRASGEYKKAISTLEQCLKNPLIDLPPSEISKINTEIGSIWYREENNVPLATGRFITATSEPAQPSAAILDQVEEFFEKTSNAGQLKRLYEIRVKGDTGRADFETIERSAKYMNRMGHHKDAIKAVQKLMTIGRYQQWYIDIISDAFIIPDAEWAELAIAMNAVESRQLPKDALPMWRLVTGRCATKANDTSDLAIKCFCEAKVIPLISPEESKYVISNLANQADLKALEKFATSRISYADEPEKIYIFRIIIDKNLTSADGIFDNAIAQHTAKSGDLGISLSRVKNLAQRQMSRAITVLISELSASLTDREKNLNFLDEAIKIIAEISHRDLQDCLESAINLREQISPSEDEKTALTIKLLLSKDYVELATRCVKRSILQGKVAIQNADLIHSMFIENPEIIAQWHHLNIARSSDAKHSLKHAKQSLHFWLQSDERPEVMIDAIMKISSQEQLLQSQLELLESLSIRFNKIPQLIEALNTQLERNADDRLDLLCWTVRVVTAHHLDIEFAAKLFKKWGETAFGSKTYQLFGQGVLWLRSGNLHEAQRSFSALLNRPEILDTPEICMTAIDYFAKAKPDKSQLASVMQSLLAWAETASQKTLSDLLVTKSIELQVARSEDLHQIFLTRFDDMAPAELANIAIQALIKAERHPSGISKIMAEWQETRIIADNPSKWQRVITCLTEEHMIRQLRRTARCEILFVHAKNLFENEARRFDAIPHMEVIAIENPMDSRVWIPLYSLYEESHAKQKLIEHLERIIPLIERDKSLLERTPFNLESLRSTLKRARSSNHSIEGAAIPLHKTAAKANTNTFELVNHAVQMQQAWVDAIPVVKISAVSNDLESNQARTEESREAVIRETTLGTAGIDGSSAVALINLPDPTSPNSSTGNGAITDSRSQLKIVSNQTNGSLQPLINWRELVQSQTPPIGFTKKLMTMAFASELEKHVAVQCVALLSGETSELENWHWQVWRNADAFQYPTLVAGRLPVDSGFSHYGGQLHKLIKMTLPIILKVHRTRFVAKSYLSKIGLPPGSPSIAIELSNAALQRGALKLFEQQISAAKAVFFDTVGLGQEVFFDLSKRAFHCDAKWQLGLPQSILTYRILENLTHFQKGNTGITLLDPESEILPVIQNIKQVLSSTGLERLRIAFGIDHREIHQQLKTMNREQLVSLLAWNADRTAADIRVLQGEMRVKALSHILAMTLDVVGIAEALTGKDLCQPGTLRAGEIKSLHPLMEQLLLIATKMNL